MSSRKMVNEITEYMIVASEDGYKLVGIVQEFINKGWQPLGGVTMCKVKKNSFDISVDTLLQSMVKYKNSDAADVVWPPKALINSTLPQDA